MSSLPFGRWPPWLLLMHGLFCSLNWASLMDFFLFSHSWWTAGHEWGTELLLVSHFCFKTPFLLSVIIFTILHENSCHHILSPLALLWHVSITISYSSSLTEEFDTWSPSFLLIIFVHFNIVDDEYNDLRHRITYLPLLSLPHLLFCLEPMSERIVLLPLQ